jgi:hypothetical protein
MVLFPVVRPPLAALGLALVTLAVFPFPAQGQPQPVTIKAIRLSPSPAGPVVTIEADGALPEPIVGEVDGPPRVFLDFPGVLTSARSVTQSVAVVKRVRVALHNATPPSTRVVLDLERQQLVRVDASAKAAGRLTVLVGDTIVPSNRPAAPPPTPEILPTTPPKPPTQPGGVPAFPSLDDTPIKPVVPLSPAGPAPTSTSTPPPAPPSVSSPPTTAPTAPPPSVPAPPPPNRPGVTKIPEREAGKYREQVGQPLERLRAMRQTLVAIDQQQSVPSLTANRTEVSAILRTLNTVRPSEVVRGTHDLLVRSASLALMALTLRDAPPGEPPNQEALRNAASAAAGALLLLDRVCMEIGCTAA